MKLVARNSDRLELEYQILNSEPYSEDNHNGNLSSFKKWSCNPLITFEFINNTYYIVSLSLCTDYSRFYCTTSPNITKKFFDHSSICNCDVRCRCIVLNKLMQCWHLCADGLGEKVKFTFVSRHEPWKD